MLKHNIVGKFTLIFLVLVAAHWILFIVSPDGLQKTIFFGNGNDFMADFFNHLRYVAKGNPYFGDVGAPQDKIFLPFAYVLLFPISRLAHYSNMSLRMCWRTPIALISAIFFLLANCFFFYFALKKLCDKWAVRDFVLIPLFLSGLLIFTLERGNLVLTSASCVAYFIALYDSNDALQRRIAIVMLAVAAVLKIFPALFGVLYLKKKMYYEAFLAAALSALLAVVPFWAFENGIDNLPKLLSNLSLYSQSYGSLSRDVPRFSANYLIYLCFTLARSNPDMAVLGARLGEALLKVFAIASVFLSLVTDDEYISLLLVSLGVIFLPVSSELYCGLYLFPAIILFFKATERLSKTIVLLHSVFYLFYLSPLQFVGSKYAIDAATILFLCVNLITCVFYLFQKRKRTPCISPELIGENGSASAPGY